MGLTCHKTNIQNNKNIQKYIITHFVSNKIILQEAMSRIMRKTTFSLAKKKRRSDDPIPLLYKSKISSFTLLLLAIFYACSVRLVSDLFENPIVGSLTRLKCLFHYLKKSTMITYSTQHHFLCTSISFSVHI